jgi:hypothetical protein
MLCASWCNKTGRSRRRLLPGGGGWGASPAVGSLFFLPGKGQAWQHFRAFFLNGLQGAGVEPRRFEDRWSDLPRLDHPRVNAGSVAGVGDDQQYLAIVVGESAMLGDLAGATRVHRPDIRGDDDVRSAGVEGRVGKRQLE